MKQQLTSPTRVQDILKRHGHRPDKSFGQNFLIDSNALNAIVEAAAITPGQTAVEFGPGLGVLTEQLARRAGRVIAVELDGRLLPILAETLSDYDNVTVLHQDALEFDYSQVPEGSSLVANLPYNVATPLIMQALNSGRISRITAMVQREVAERMVASPGDSAFGAWSLLVRYHADARIVRDVSPACFLPAPEVTSSIVHLTVKSDVKPDNDLTTLIHDAFRHRRKTLRKNLTMAGRGAAAAATALAALGLDQRVRAEELGLEQFRQLHALLQKQQQAGTEGGLG